VPIVTFPICLTGTIAFGEEFGKFVKILLDCDAQGALMQRGGWMVHRDNQAMPDFLWDAMNLRDPFSGEEAGHRKSAQRNDHIRIEDADLTLEVGSAGLDLIG
jgi:hypothetical protein